MQNIDPDLAKLVQAQLDANKIAQAELNIKRRLEAAQLETISSNESLKQEVSDLIKETRQMLGYMRKSALKEDALHDWFEYLANKVDRLELGLTLSLMSRLDQPEIKSKVIDIISDIDKEHRERLKSQHFKNLAKLREQAAAHGAGNVPLDIQNSIEAEEMAINELE